MNDANVTHAKLGRRGCRHASECAVDDMIRCGDDERASGSLREKVAHLRQNELRRRPRSVRAREWHAVEQDNELGIVDRNDARFGSESRVERPVVAANESELCRRTLCRKRLGRGRVDETAKGRVGDGLRKRGTRHRAAAQSANERNGLAVGRVSGNVDEQRAAERGDDDCCVVETRRKVNTGNGRGQHERVAVGRLAVPDGNGRVHHGVEHGRVKGRLWNVGIFRAWLAPRATAQDANGRSRIGAVDGVDARKVARKHKAA